MVDSPIESDCKKVIYYESFLVCGEEDPVVYEDSDEVSYCYFKEISE